MVLGRRMCLRKKDHEIDRINRNYNELYRALPLFQVIHNHTQMFFAVAIFNKSSMTLYISVCRNTAVPGLVQNAGLVHFDFPRQAQRDHSKTDHNPYDKTLPTHLLALNLSLSCTKVERWNQVTSQNTSEYKMAERNNNNKKGACGKDNTTIY